MAMTLHRRAPCIALLGMLLSGSSLFAQPTFTLTIDAPATASGAPGDLVAIPASVILTSSGITTGIGVQGWSLGIGSAGFRILAATTAGTAGALVADGGLRLEDGFESIQFTTGTGNTGVVVGLALSTAMAASLPPSGPSQVLNLTVGAEAPNPIVSGGEFFCEPLKGRVFLVDGLKGSGQPVINKASYLGFGYRPTLGSANVEICPRIDIPKFSLSLEAPAQVEGAADSAVQFEETVHLETSDNPGEDGAQGWSLSIAAQKAKIVAATVAGTVGAPVAEGGLRMNDGFQKTEITTGAGNEGVVSAVTLSTGSPVMLPPVGTESLLRLTVEATVPRPIVSEGAFVCSPVEARVFFVDGRQGSGQPVKNRISFFGIGEVPTVSDATTEVCPTMNEPEYALRLTAPANVGGDAGNAVSFTATCHVDSTNNPGPDGAQGWSLSLAAENGQIVEATTDGTKAATVPDGGLRLKDGFLKTELTTGPGNEGLTHALVLSTQGGAWLPPTGTAAVLKLQVEATVPEPGTGQGGEPVCDPRVVRVYYIDGLVGSGQPVKNRVSYRGIGIHPTLGQSMTEVCPGGAGGGQIPGDMNQDARLDISDAPALLGHMFLGTFPQLPCTGGDRTTVNPGLGNLSLLDSNGDARIDLSDVVWNLSYLFLGGSEPVLGTVCVRIVECPDACAP